MPLLNSIYVVYIFNGDTQVVNEVTSLKIELYSLLHTTIFLLVNDNYENYLLFCLCKGVFRCYIRLQNM